MVERSLIVTARRELREKCSQLCLVLIRQLTRSVTVLGTAVWPANVAALRRSLPQQRMRSEPVGRAEVRITAPRTRISLITETGGVVRTRPASAKPFVVMRQLPEVSSSLNLLTQIILRSTPTGRARSVHFNETLCSNLNPCCRHVLELRAPRHAYVWRGLRSAHRDDFRNRSRRKPRQNGADTWRYTACRTVSRWGNKSKSRAKRNRG